MSIEEDSQSNSQYLSASQASLNLSKKTSSEISRTYKHASQLYLTRRLSEAYEALQPIIRPPKQISEHDGDEVAVFAPIATASTSQRIKTWSLYITLINAIADLGLDEGGRDFGEKEHRAIVNQVRDGEIWEQVVRDGYHGREGSVDAEVVYNLSTLLLGQASDQVLNQTRLETYLSSSPQSDLDVSNRLLKSPSKRSQSQINGADTPRELASRLKILELFTLHVLPRNEEWEYARSFIRSSDILDEEHREAFLQTLHELQEVKDKGSQQGDEAGEAEREPEMRAQPEEDVRTHVENLATSEEQRSLGSNSTGRKRTSSEVDYGIDMSHPNGTPTLSGANTQLKPEGKTSTSKSTPSSQVTASGENAAPLPQVPPPPPSRASAAAHLSSPPTQTPKNRAIRKSAGRTPSSAHNNVFTQAQHFAYGLQNLARNLAGAITKNPTTLFRALLFLLAFLIAFSRKQVRHRVQRIVAKGWQKLRGTVGMGVKVSYI